MPRMPRLSPSASTVTSRAVRLIPRRASFIAIAVEQQAAIDARKYQPGLGAEASPPIALAMSVTIVSPDGPVTLHLRPSVSVAVAVAYLACAFSGFCLMAALTVSSAVAIAEVILYSRLAVTPSNRRLQGECTK